MIESIKQKATFLNNLSNNEAALFEYLNTNHDNLDEVIQQYKPAHEFRPVNTLRFLLANELKKGTPINSMVIEDLKEAIENRDVSSYYNLNDAVKQSLINYKDSKVGMFPNWKHVFKILFPFIHNASENGEVKRQLNQLADDIIKANQLENVTKHIVSFQGSQNYGSDRVWVAIIPKSAASVQYAYQIFFTIDKNGLVGGVHKGHNLVKQTFKNQDDKFETWDSYLSRTKAIKEEWTTLNSNVDFLIINDEKNFQKSLKKIEPDALKTYFYTLDNLVEELEIQDEENLVFSVSNNQLSFQVGKRYCLNVKKNVFDFITYNEIEGASLAHETFSEPSLAYLYKRTEASLVLEHFENIKNAVDIEIGRDNHTSAKTYDNSAFRKAVFDKAYRNKLLGNKHIMDNKYFLVGAYWDSQNPKDQTNRFIKEGIWVNGYDDKFNDIVNSVQIGDKIVIKAPDRRNDRMYIKAKGTVLKNHFDGQNLDVNWENDFEIFIVDFSGGYWDTIKEITNKSHIDAIWNNKENLMEDDNNQEPSYKASINQIFYGPPGTGKTYNTILEAAKIITQNPDISYNAAQDVFNKNLGENIEFITFHQNYSYEDFIQGLRPDTDLSGELSFFKSDGVFKKIADRALKNLRDSENPELAKKTFDNVFYELIEPLNEDVVDELEIKMKQTSFYITEVGEKSIEFRKNQGASKHTLSIATLKKMYDLGTNNIILGGLQPYYNPILNLLLEKGKSGFTNSVKQNYVIIIDEINRANISRVFGELITLIEKDKRSNGKIPITATLPSGEQFIVPSNLYIIGTMNTADKSIALLDIALRRRFEFVPMYPKYQLEDDNFKIENADTLEKINNEIISRKGHDFTIGHSYFMGEDYDFKNTIDKKVVPLLLEYFMNDYNEVKAILKAAELEVEGWPLQLKL